MLIKYEVGVYITFKLFAEAHGLYFGITVWKKGSIDMDRSTGELM
jgi:hypothetical protein